MRLRAGPLVHARAYVPAITLLLLAGCLGATRDAPVDPASLGGALQDAVGYAFACPPGVESDATPCVGVIESLTESLQEPFLAADPYRVGVFAIGVNAGATRDAFDPAREVPGVEQFRLDIFVTQDGGATWALARLPRVDTGGISPLPVEIYGAGDPAIAFDEHGVMHVSGIATPGGVNVGYEVFYTSSPDLGKTWTTPVIFGGDDDNDRNWLNVAPGDRVYVPWQNVGTSTELALSLDGGATWRTTPPVEECFTVSPVQLLDGVAYLACAGYSPGSGPTDPGELTGTRVFRVDEANATLVEVGEIAGEHVWPHLRALPGGELVAIAESDGSVSLSRSADAGVSWSEPVDLRDITSIDDAWASATMFWADVDPSGTLHFVLGGTENRGPGMNTPHLAAVAIDVAAGQAVFEGELPIDAPMPPRTLAPAYGDHYYGLAFQGDQGMVVWTRDRTLQFTTIVPSAPEAS